LTIFGNLSKLKEDAQKLKYSTFNENFKRFLDIDSLKYENEIYRIEYSQNSKITKCPEPLYFNDHFNDAKDQTECRQIFDKLLETFESVDLSEVPSDGIWFNRTDRGINLRPGSRDGESSEIQAIQLGDNSVHGIIVGRTGSGKSVFLNNLIFNMITEYPPWEIDIYLADFKKIELSRYLSAEEANTPHVNACIATSEIRYVISLLEYLVKCMKARESLFQNLGINKIQTFREKYKDYNLVLPRVLLLVDEFQQLFLEATNKEAVRIGELLTSITKLGRATGFHLLFASQDMSGTLTGKVFANFKARFALPCDSDVSSQVLGNSKAAEINEKGIVLVNTKSGNSDENIRYKVPFISDEETIDPVSNEVRSEFYDYLRFICKQSKNYNFKKIQKYYNEDRALGIDELTEFASKYGYKKQVKEILSRNKGTFESIILGEPVVYTNKERDFESFFIERGKKKNIGVLCTRPEDLAYIQKLLAENFKNSTKKDSYRHHLISRNPIISSMYDIREDLYFKEDNIDYTGEYLINIVNLYEQNKKTFENLTKYNDLYKYINDTVELLKKSSNPGIVYLVNAFLTQELIDRTFRDIDINNLEVDFNEKVAKDKVLEILRKYVDAFRKYHLLKLDIYECIPMHIVWISGLENMENLDKNFKKSLRDSLEYNVLYILFATSDETVSDYLKECDYLFINTPNEKQYNRYGVNFTKKEEDSIAIDFKICSFNTERSFKKFRYNMKDFIVPKIDFDYID
jgi:hypothetical protein